MSNGINLLNFKNKTEVKSTAAAHTKLRSAAVGMLFIVSAAAVMIFILIAFSPLPELNKKSSIASFTLSKSISDVVKLGLVNDRTDTIKNIIDKRLQHDIILDDLQRSVPSGLTIEALSVEKKEVSIEVSGNSLLEIDEFLNGLSKNDKMSIKLSKVLLSRLQLNTESNRFIVSVDLNIL